MKNAYYYLDDTEHIIRIKSSRRPSITTRSWSGTWIVNEFNGKKWIMPCCSEITWTTLSKLTYIGKTKC